MTGIKPDPSTDEHPGWVSDLLRNAVEGELRFVETARRDVWKFSGGGYDSTANYVVSGKAIAGAEKPYSWFLTKDGDVISGPIPGEETDKTVSFSDVDVIATKIRIKGETVPTEGYVEQKSSSVVPMIENKRTGLYHELVAEENSRGEVTVAVDQNGRAKNA